MKYAQRRAIRDREYLDYLRAERCVITGQYGSEHDAVDPVHIGTRGRGLKTDDEALPILHSLHAQGHASGEISMLRERAPDDLLRAAFRALARENYREYLSTVENHK
jgi:hypothetical protein